MLLRAEPLDQYGGDIDVMRNGGLWAHVGDDFELSTANVRTGTYSLLSTGATGGSNGSINAVHTARQVFGSALVTAGVSFAAWFDRLPAVETGFGGLRMVHLCTFLDAAGDTQIACVLGTDGSIAVYRGYSWGLNGGLGTLLYRSDPCFRAGCYNHFEAKVTIDNAAGAVEIRVNLVTVVNLTGIDTQNTSNASTTQYLISRGWSDFVDTGDVHFSDIYCWDDSGAVNNDFCGDQKCYYLGPNADTAQADWSPSTGAVDYAMVDEAPPNDADYLFLAATTGSTHLGLQNLPADVVAVLGVIPMLRGWKSDAGVCELAPGINSNGSLSTPAGQNITTGAQYYQQVVEEDPDAAGPFTPAAVNALELVVERTA